MLTPWTPPPTDYERNFVPANDRIDPIELLRRSGYQRTFRDALEDLIFDIRIHPQLAAVVFGFGMLAGLLGVIVPAIIVALVTR